MPGPHQVSNKGLAFNACREACCLTVHRDTKRPVVGFGMNDDALVLGDTIEFEDAIARYVVASADYDADVNDVFGDIPLAQNEVDALWSLDWNAGGTTFRRCTDLIHKVKQYALAPNTTPAEIAVRRRMADRAIFEFTQVKYDAETDAYFNLSRRMLEGALFRSGNYGDLTKLRFYGKGLYPKDIVVNGVFHAASPYTEIDMPRFK